MFAARVIRITAEALFLILVVVSCGQEPPATTPGPAPTEMVPLSPTDTLPDGGGFNAPDPSSLPEDTAPLGLGDIGLADNATDILALFNSLPPNLMGGDRTIQSNGELGVSYGTTQPVGCGTIGLQATDVSTGDFFPDGWTAEKVIAVFTTGADWEVEGFGRDGDLFWAVLNTTCGSDDAPGADSIFSTSWGKAGSPWVFSASAGESDGRDDLTAAFVGIQLMLMIVNRKSIESKEPHPGQGKGHHDS